MHFLLVQIQSIPRSRENLIDLVFTIFIKFFIFFFIFGNALGSFLINLDLTVMTVAFGSQAARFDTAGVHPDRKLPGHFIQYTYTREATKNEMSHMGKSKFLLTKWISPVNPESDSISVISLNKLKYPCLYSDTH